MMLLSIKLPKAMIWGTLLASSWLIAVPSYCPLRPSSPATIFNSLPACRKSPHRKVPGFLYNIKVSDDKTYVYDAFVNRTAKSYDLRHFACFVIAYWRTIVLSASPFLACDHFRKSLSVSTLSTRWECVSTHFFTLQWQSVSKHVFISLNQA